MISNEVIIFWGEVPVPMDVAKGYFILRNKICLLCSGESKEIF